LGFLHIKCGQTPTQNPSLILITEAPGLFEGISQEEIRRGDLWKAIKILLSMEHED